MKAAPHPDQARRLAALYDLDILDTEHEREFDEIAELVAAICDAPVGVVNLIDADRQWFKAETGLGVRSTPLETSLCSHVILEGDYVEIPDTLADKRMSDNPLCQGEEGFRFYAGAVLTSEEGLPLGTLCVLDTKPRQLSAFQRQTVETLGRQVTRLLDLRLALKRQNLLAREVDHRVKNSLAMIAAIVRLQSARSESGEVKAALETVQTRLAAITALHEELHQTVHASIGLAGFLDRLRRHLRPLLPGGVGFELACEPAHFASDVVSAIGLIVNEFVANAAKHGLGAEGIGAVAIEGRRDGDSYLLTCRNDGAADEAALAAIRSSTGLGTRIIASTAQAIGGSADWQLGDPGVVLELRLPTDD